MIEITASKLERARAAREVATALALFLSGKFHAPRLMMYDSIIRTALCRVDRESSDGVSEAIADALLFGQCVESYLLGMSLPDPAKFPAGVRSTLTRAVINSDLWRPVVKALVDLLLKDGRITGAQITAASEGGNAGGGHSTGDRLGRRRLGDGELKPHSLTRRRRQEKQLAAGRN